MFTVLLLGLGTFVACWLLHAIVWRIHRPAAYPIWLPIIFFVVPAVAVAIANRVDWTPPFPVDLPTAIVAALLHASIAACYMGGYAGVIEYSPSAEILRVVRASMPAGIAPQDLVVTSLSEQALTGKRIAHLIVSRMAAPENGALRLTARGRLVVLGCRVYRATFGITQEAKG